MTDMDKTGEQDIAAFYDWLAPDYDDMTGFEKRFVQEGPFFRLLVDRYGIRNALDAGSGSGFHSLLLASLGVQVTAVDISAKMTTLLKEHAKAMELPVKTEEASFVSLPTVIHGQFDALFCMGNSLAHTLTTQGLSEALKSFVQVIRPGGILFIQNLNYDRILLHHNSVQSVKESKGVTFIRYYEYTGETIRFNILKLKRETTGIVHELKTVELRPILRDNLLGLLTEIGFDDVKTYGGITLEEFQPDTSKDLVVLAKKTQ